MREWGKQFDVPLLKLTPIDTIKSLVLNPAQLGTVKAAQGLAARADSTRQALEQGFQAARHQADTWTARGRWPTGSPRPIPSSSASTAPGRRSSRCRQTLKQLDQAKQRLTGLRQNVETGVKRLGSGVQDLDEARKRDYAFARSLLKLPAISAPDIGNSFFGKVSIDRFQQALYWAELARHYMPPGLLPRENPGPERLRAAGKMVRFPKEHEWPQFLMRLGQVDFRIDAGPAQGRLRRDRAGAHVRAGAVRQADGGVGPARRGGLGHRRARRRRRDRPPHGQRARLGLGQAPRGQAAVVRHSGAAVPDRAGHRQRQPQLRPAGRPAPGPVVHRVERGELGARQRRGRRQRPGAGRVAGGLGAQAARRGRPGHRHDHVAQALGPEQPGRRRRPAAQGRHRRGGRQGRGAGAGQGGQPGGATRWGR